MKLRRHTRLRFAGIDRSHKIVNRRLLVHDQNGQRVLREDVELSTSAIGGPLPAVDYIGEPDRSWRCTGGRR